MGGRRLCGRGAESGVLNRTRTAQRAFGTALQWTHYVGAHQFAVGLTHDNTRAPASIKASRAVS